MVVVTIDSNVSRIPRMVAEHLFRPARAWCRSIGDCDKRKSPADAVVYYDTPLALDRLSEYPDDMFDGFLNFVYLDLAERNASTERLLENMRHRGENDDRLVLVLNNVETRNERPKRTAKVVYAMKTINCSDGIVAEAIAALINAFLYEGRLLHPVDVISLSCGKAVRRFRKLDDNDEMPFDVQQLIRCRNVSKPFENDCVDCRSSTATSDVKK